MEYGHDGTFEQHVELLVLEERLRRLQGVQKDILLSLQQADTPENRSLWQRALRDMQEAEAETQQEIAAHRAEMTER